MKISPTEYCNKVLDSVESLGFSVDGQPVIIKTILSSYGIGQSVIEAANDILYNHKLPRRDNESENNNKNL